MDRVTCKLWVAEGVGTPSGALCKGKKIDHETQSVVEKNVL